MSTDPCKSAVDPDILASQCHPHCLVCGDGKCLGLKRETRPAHEGRVECTFHCEPELEGYPSQLHGGVIGLFFDAAMTRCLFAHGHMAVTAELRVRYRRPVMLRRHCLVRAWIRRDRPPLHDVDAELLQEGEIKATASAKFLDRR